MKKLDDNLDGEDVVPELGDVSGEDFYDPDEDELAEFDLSKEVDEFSDNEFGGSEDIF